MNEIEISFPEEGVVQIRVAAGDGEANRRIARHIAEVVESNLERELLRSDRLGVARQWMEAANNDQLRRQIERIRRKKQLFGSRTRIEKSEAEFDDALRFVDSEPDTTLEEE